MRSPIRPSSQPSSGAATARISHIRNRAEKNAHIGLTSDLSRSPAGAYAGALLLARSICRTGPGYIFDAALLIASRMRK
ncbi:hypothetical protein GCM10010464_25680 [Pseudonocardia yunnanensis]